MIVCAYGLFQLKSYIKINKIWYAMVALILFSSFAWSVYEVDRVQSYTYWSKSADFINKNYPDRLINANPHDTLPIGFIVNNKVRGVQYLDFEYLIPAEGELVIFTHTEDIPATRGGAPLDSNLLLLTKKSDLSSKEFRTYIEEHGEKIFTGYYEGSPAVEIYEVTAVDSSLTPRYNAGIVGAPVPEPPLIIGLWGFLCSAYNNDAGQSLIENTSPSSLLGSVRQRCGG